MDEQRDGILSVVWAVLAYMCAGVVLAVTVTGLAVLTVRAGWRRFRGRLDAVVETQSGGSGG